MTKRRPWKRTPSFPISCSSLYIAGWEPTKCKGIRHVGGFFGRIRWRQMEADGDGEKSRDCPRRPPGIAAASERSLNDGKAKSRFLSGNLFTSPLHRICLVDLLPRFFHRPGWQAAMPMRPD